MVEELIRKYMEAGGQTPCAVVSGIDVIQGNLPPNVFCVYVPALEPGAIGAMPLQCALDFVLRPVWVMDDAEEADGE